jgi:hypothetical protein
MEFKYRGITFTITQGTTPDLWRWHVMVGNPKMLRIGEAQSEKQADEQAKAVIDRSIELSLRTKRLSDL